MTGTRHRSERLRMVESQLRARGISDERVLDAMCQVPRHEFIPPRLEAQAYSDAPLPIGAGQTISQPYIVALMTEMLRLEADQKVLEIGTGSGYQAAILARLVREVYTIEVLEHLFVTGRERLERLGYSNVHTRLGDGSQGWPEAAPFDRIVVTACAREVPAALFEQLRIGGAMVIPIGESDQTQTLYRITPSDTGMDMEEGIPVRFVRMR